MLIIMFDLRFCLHHSTAINQRYQLQCYLCQQVALLFSVSFSSGPLYFLRIEQNFSYPIITLKYESDSLQNLLRDLLSDCVHVALLHCALFR